MKVYEAGATVAANVKDWGHVRLFSPWEYNTDTAARALLQSHGWQEPPGKAMPTGSDLYEAYLKPLAETPEMAAVIETGAKVKAITRQGADKVLSRGRETKPFVLAVSNGNGAIRRDLARAVIDASGTWTAPNPLGAGGILAEGEAENAGHIAYGIPDVLGRDRATYEGRTTLVVGAGHSAANVLLDLARLAEAESRDVHRLGDPRREPDAGLRRRTCRPAPGPRRARLQAQGARRQRTGHPGGRLLRHPRPAVDGQVIVEGETASGLREVGPVDRIVVSTGQRPDLNLTRELRLDLDPWLESSKALGPLIDPNLHSCGSVPPHGHRELAHPEPGFYTVGIKSYGRAPTFLMLTGYEQVRSVVAAIAGDLAAADDIHLVLPETGVCSTNLPVDGATASSGCCGGPAPAEVDACCVADAEAKAEGKSGCGCGPAKTPEKVAEPAGCC